MHRTPGTVCRYRMISGQDLAREIQKFIFLCGLRPRYKGGGTLTSELLLRGRGPFYPVLFRSDGPRRGEGGVPVAGGRLALTRGVPVAGPLATAMVVGHLDWTSQSKITALRNVVISIVSPC